MTTTPQADGANASSHELQRKLSNRHLQLIAIGGAIGTGLFMGCLLYTSPSPRDS